MTVLVTGATGFVGANLLRELAKTEKHIHIFLRETSNTWRIKDILDQVTINYCDLADRKNVAVQVAEVQPDIIFHAATYGGYPNQTDFFQIASPNFLGTANLLDACVKEGFECFINTGTSSEYGIKEHRMIENDLPEPGDTYGVTKTAATLYCQSVAKRCSSKIFTLRLFSPYGYFEDSNRFVPYVMQNCLENMDLELSNPNFVRDFIFMEDIVEAYLTVAKAANRLAQGDVFNVGSGKQHNLKEIVDLITALTGYTKKAKWGSRATRQRDTTDTWEADIEKIHQNTGWIPRTPLQDGIRKTLNWLKSTRNKESSNPRIEL
jgi:nucleoside-diphosphate-sugar epimerase